MPLPAAPRVIMPCAWVLMTTAALVTAALTVPYVTSGSYDSFFHGHYVEILPLVLAHGLAGAAVLALGPVQFLPWMRSRWPDVHRDIGRLYLAGLCISGIAGLCMSAVALGGSVVRAGSCVAATLWLLTMVMGVRAIRCRRVEEHRRWMMYNFALTLSVVTCRLYLAVFQDLGWTIQEIAPWIAWLAWIPNLLAAELLARLDGPSPP